MASSRRRQIGIYSIVVDTDDRKMVESPEPEFSFGIDCFCTTGIDRVLVVFNFASNVCPFRSALEISKKNQFRHLKITKRDSNSFVINDNRKLLSFACNDYISLSTDKRLKERYFREEFLLP